jgi:hypothetical protein
MYELWLIVCGIIMVSAACRLSCCFIGCGQFGVLKLGMRRGVWWSLILPIKICDRGFYICCGRIVKANILHAVLDEVL